MKSFEELTKEYCEQADRLRGRAAALSAEITEAQKTGEVGRLKQLSERRQTLYYEIWEMESSIKQMREYCKNMAQRGCA